MENQQQTECGLLYRQDQRPIEPYVLAFGKHQQVGQTNQNELGAHSVGQKQGGYPVSPRAIAKESLTAEP